MDVLHFTHQFAPETHGGVESYLLDVASEQRARGADVRVLTGSHQPWDQVGAEELSVGSLPVWRLHRDDMYFDLHSKAWHPGVEAFLRGFLRRWRPRLVHVHQWIRLTANLVELARAEGIPTVVTIHDFYTSCPRAFRMPPGTEACTRPLGTASCIDCVPRYGHESRAELAEGIELFADQTRSELALAQAVLVAVPSTAELIAETTGVPRERFSVLPLGYRRRFPGALPLPGPGAEGPLRFAFWGGIAPHKGVGVLLEAFRRLLATPTPRPVELHVLGHFATPRYERELRGDATGLPVHLHGPFETERLRALGLHVGVFPSTCLETFGIVLDECFELGLPCVVSDHGALAARAGAGGLRARPGDPDDLARTLRRFLDEPGLWDELRRGLPELPPELDEHCTRLEVVYHEATEAARRLPPVPSDARLAERRVALLLRQRESALRRLVPPDGFR